MIVVGLEEDPMWRTGEEGVTAFSDNVCGAKTRNGGKCQQPAMENGRCRIHGGKTPKGIYSGSFKHGRYSKSLPTHLAVDYETARDDPRLLDLSEDIALVDLRTSELLTRLSDGGSNESSEDIGRDLPRLRMYIEQVETQSALDLVDHLFDLWMSSRQERETWQEVYLIVNQRRQLVESEKKRLVDMNLMIAADRAYLLITALQDIILRHVHDAPARSAIADEIRRLTTSSAS